MQSQEIAFVTTLILNTRENKTIWSPGPTPDVIVSEDNGRLISFQPEPRYLSVIYRGKDKHTRFYVNKALCDQLIAYINHQSKTLIKNEETEDEVLSMAINEMISNLSFPTAPVEIVPVHIPVATKVQPVVIPELPKVEPIVIPKETVKEVIISESDLLPDKLAETVKETMKRVDVDIFSKHFKLSDGTSVVIQKHSLDAGEMYKAQLRKQLVKTIQRTLKYDLVWTVLHDNEDPSKIIGFTNCEKDNAKERFCSNGEVNIFVLKDMKGHLFYKTVDSAITFGQRKSCSGNIYGNAVKELLVAIMASYADNVRRELLTMINTVSGASASFIEDNVEETTTVPFLDILNEAIEKSGTRVTTEKLPVNTAEMNKRLEVKYSDGRFLEFTYVDNTELRCYLCTGGKNKRIFINRFKDVSAMMAIIASMHV